MQICRRKNDVRIVWRQLTDKHIGVGSSIPMSERIKRNYKKALPCQFSPQPQTARGDQKEGSHAQLPFCDGYFQHMHVPLVVVG